MRLAARVGTDDDGNVSYVLFSYDVEITDADLKCLAGLPNLRSLTISGPRITDEGLSQLKDLGRLTELTIGTTNKVTTAGLRHVSGLTTT